MTYRYEIDFYDNSSPLPKGWHTFFPLNWSEARDIGKRLSNCHAGSYSYRVTGFLLEKGYYKRDGFWLKDEIYTPCGVEDTIYDFMRYRDEQHWIDVRG
jgi:hypothetical protein